MDEPVTITEVKIRLADKPEGGLIGWASCVLNGTFLLDRIAIYRNENGKITIFFPSAKSRRGNRYPYFRPLTHAVYEETRKAIVSRLILLGKEARGDGARRD